MTPARISLLVPCRNAAAHLPRLFEGVAAQTRRFDEILCYDDNSTDDTARVAASLGARVLPAEGPSTGPAHARNRLAAAASGEWIHFHDADDIIAPDYLERMCVPATGDCDVVFCDADWVEEDSRRLVIPWHYDGPGLAADPVSYLVLHPVGVNNGVLRRDRFLAVGGFDESLLMWEDCDVYVRLAAAGARFTHVPRVLSWSLRHTDSFSHDYRKSWSCRLDALHAYAATLGPGARPAVACEAERAASELFHHGDPKEGRRALALCRSLGHRVPTTRNPALRLLGAAMPGRWALALQRGWRAKRSP